MKLIDSLDDIRGTLCVEVGYTKARRLHPLSLPRSARVLPPPALFWTRRRLLDAAHESFRCPRPAARSKRLRLDRNRGHITDFLLLSQAMNFVLSHSSVPIVTARATAWDCILGLQDGRYEAYISDNNILEWVRHSLPASPPPRCWCALFSPPLSLGLKTIQ